VGQAGDLLAENDAIVADVGGADLEQIVEAARDHVAFLDFGDAADGGVEFIERGLARIGQLDLGEGDVIETELGRIGHGAKAEDHAALDQPPQPHLAWRLGEADAPGKIGDGDTSIVREHGDDLAIEHIQIDRC